MLGLSLSFPFNGTGVVLQTPDNSDRQIWSKSATNEDGYFILQNPISGRVLTADSSLDEDFVMVTGSNFI